MQGKKIKKPTVQPEKIKKLKKPTMQSLRYFPHDIISQILLRLPVKSLLRFTSVSKSWKASIESSSFISAHHRHHVDTSSNNTRSSRCSNLVYIANPLRKNDKNCTMVPETVDHGVLEQIPLPRLWNCAWLVGSCEGLIFLKEKYIMHLWNPFTRTMRRLPLGKIQCTDDWDRFLGFGFAHRSGDHRVVKLLVCKRTYSTEAEVYSLASDSWKRVELEVSFQKKLGFTEFYLHSMVSLKGSIYWSVSRGIRNPPMVLRFDLEEERFELIEVGVTTTPPPMVDNGFLHLFEYEIMVVDGFLVLLEFKVIYCRWSNKRRWTCLKRGYINKESESGSSSWVATKTIELPIRDGDIRRAGGLYAGSHNILVTSLHLRLFVYDGYCDGKNLNFKPRRDLEINNELYNFTISLKENLFLLNKNAAKGVIDGRTRRVRH